MSDSINNVLKKIIKYAPIPLILVYIIMIIVSNGFDGTYNTNMKSTLPTYDEGWTCEINGKEEDIQFPYVPGVNSIDLKKTLSKVDDGELLILKYCYGEVVAKVDGVVIYESSTPTLGHIKTHLGTNMFGIPMNDDYSNKEIVISINRFTDDVQIGISHIYLCTAGDFLLDIIRNNVFQIILCMLLFLFSIFSLSIFIIVRWKKNAKIVLSPEYFISFAIFTFGTAMWMLTDINVLFALTGHQAANDIISLVSFMLIPIGAMQLVYNVTKEHETIFNVLSIVYFLNFFVQTLLFLIFGVNLHSMLIISQASMFIGLAISAVLIVLSLRHNPTTNNMILMGGFILFAIFCVVSMFGYFFASMNFKYSLVFVIGMFLLAIAFQIILVRSFIKMIKSQLIFERTLKYAYTDELTGVGNRRAYSEALSNAKHEGKNNFTIIGFDVNYLKKTNDVLGHKAGDELLIGAASCISEVFANEKRDNVFRTGGDEFAAIVEMSDEDLEEHISAFKIITKNFKGEIINNISVAYGYASSIEYPDLAPEELAMKADEKMYANKKAMHAERKK